MTPTSDLAGLLVIAFATLGSAEHAAVPALRDRAGHLR